MKILLVDDSSVIRNIQKNILSRIGDFEIDEAADGVEALKQMESVVPDLVLVDLNMPNMDGLTFVKEVRGGGSKVPMIMVTTEAERCRVLDAVKAGVNNYVVKPFTPDVLAEKINETIAKVSA
jgi:two-component system chemotaxis response regulator CheY